MGPLALLVLALTVTACAGGAGPGEEGSDGTIGEVHEAASVGDYLTNGCSTEVVLPLSTQIADEVGCTRPGALVPFMPGAGVTFSGSAVLPYLAQDAKDDLLAAVAAHGGTVQVNSAFRTVVQQHLLYRWWQDGRCGITAAATPGTSNHETGRAVDLGDDAAWISAMGAHGWAHDVPGDPVHFDHLASPDLRGADVQAFQGLWNRNHPEDPIAEDGSYGPATGARIDRSPADGFAIGACPAAPPPTMPPTPPPTTPPTVPPTPPDGTAPATATFDPGTTEGPKADDPGAEGSMVAGGCTVSPASHGGATGALAVSLLAIVLALRSRAATRPSAPSARRGRPRTA